MIDTLITALSKELELSAEEIADTIWLALQIQESQLESTATQKLKNDLSQPSLKSKELEGETLPETKTKTSDSRETASKQSPEEQKAGIYPRNQQETLFKSELSFKVPDAPSLREPLTLARALKPLMRRIPSGTTLVLDEAATTQEIANEGLWLPVLRPTLEPWLDLELVVDEGISMQIWRHTIRELERLLKNYGIFRDVRVWGLIADNLEQVQIRRGIGATAKNQSPRSPAELIDPSGRRLVLVVSDCVSSLWRDGKVTTTLEIWAKQGSMAIVQMLPKWLWKRTALGRASEVRLQGLNPGEFNQKLIAKEVSLWDELEEMRGVKVPVFTLEPDKVATWAQMLSGKGSIWTSGYVFKLDPIPVNKGRELFNLDYGQLSAEQRVQAFRVTASPMARKLAGLLAAAPVISLPIVRLIQRTLLKESQQVHVAEVFLGGLLKPLSEINAETNPDYVQYEFMDGVRELLVDSVPSGYVLNVVDEVSKDVAKNLGLSLEDFAAVLKNPQQVRDSDIAGDVGYFATVTAQVLRRLGGEYGKFADSLENNIAVDNLKTETAKIELLSEAGIDYIQLRNLLETGKWREADEETARLMFKIADREEEGWLRVEDIEQFPSSNLRTIDRLWVKYSNGKFGFSVQKRIYQGLGGTKEFNQEITESFWKKVGWIVNDLPYWSQYDNLTFDLSAPIGHLPIRYDVETPSGVLGVIEGILSRDDLDQDFASLELQTFEFQTIAVNSTYQIRWEGDILKVGFVDRNADGTAITASGDEIVRDAAARLQEMEAAGELKGGNLLKIDGRISVLVSYVIAHHVAHLYRAIAISDPRLNAYVVAISTAAEYPVGSRIDVATGEVKQVPSNPDDSPSFLIYWENGVLNARINNRVPADGDRIVRDAAAQLANLIDAGQLPGGKEILKINGRATTLASFAIASQVAHLYGGVAVFDPKLGEKGFDKYVVTVSHTQDFQVGETIDIGCVPQPAAKVVLCGPPHLGKTVLREALKRAVMKLENAPKDFYVISASPDGEGVWFSETAQNYPALAAKLKAEYQARLTPEFARFKAQDISNVKSSLLLFDVGGRIPTEENRIIMSQATHAIMLARTEQDVADWQEFCEKELEKPLPFIAIVYSDFEGTKDTIVSEEPVLTATVHRLARDEDASNRPTVKALAKLLVNLVGSDIYSDFEGTKDTIGQIIKNEPKTAQYFRENLPNNIPLEMAEIPGGTFVMGSPEGEGNNREKPQHEVIVQPFFIGKYLVTQAQWRAVTNLPTVNRVLNPDPSHYKGDNRPVENVSWNESVEFCDRLSLYTGKHYRLPSEAEWEYACRAGTNTPFHFGETLTPNLAIYASNRSDWHSVEYNSKNPTSRPKNVNNFGLFDMHGTLWEWCADAWHNNYEGAPPDGSIWLNENYKQKSFQSRFVVRGGSWGKPLDYCRSAYRDSEPSDYKSAYNGFRIVSVSETNDNDKEEIFQNILDGIITENPQIFELLITAEIHTFLIDRTIDSLEIPDDNTEATITGVGEPYDIELEAESTKNNGRDSLFLISFNLTVECELSYYIFKADYYTIDDEKVAKISISDWNEHYFRAEESYPLNVEGLISLKCDSRLLELSLISNEHLLAFLEKADISINEITQIEIN